MIKQYDTAGARRTTCGRSLLLESGEGCFPILLLGGTEREKGLAAGELLAERISRQVSRVMTSIYAQFGGYTEDAFAIPTKNELSAGKEAILNMVQRDLLPAMKIEAPDTLERIRGIYDGVRKAGVPIDIDDLIAFNCMPECFDHPKMCSNFAVWGEAAENGIQLHGVNQDFDTYGTLHKNIAVLVDMCNGISSMGPAFIGMAHAASFINEAGISYGELTSTSSLSAWPQIPHYTQAGLLAHHADSIDAAVDIVRRTGGTTGWTLLMCDGKGAAAIETAAVNTGVRRAPEERKGMLCATNHFRGYPGLAGFTGDDMVTPQIAYIQSDPDAMLRLFKEGKLEGNAGITPEIWLSQLSCVRYEHCVETLEAQKTGVDEAIELLSAYPLCENGDEVKHRVFCSAPFENLYGYTEKLEHQSLRSVYSILFVPARLEMYLAAGSVPAQAGTFYALSLHDCLKEYARTYRV